MNESTLKTAKQFIKFAVIGVLNTLVDLAVLNSATLISETTEGIGYAIQKGLSFLVAVTFSYFLNKHWAFQDKSKKEEGKKFSQFLFVSIIGMLINVSVATITVTYIKDPINNLLGIKFLMNDQLWVNIGGLAGTAVGLVWNFVGYKIWVFKK